MGLFSKKKSEPSAGVKPAQQPQKQTPVNADDIWNAPVRKKGGESVTIKESKYGEAVTEKLEVEAIEPEIIKSKMAQLEKELEQRKNRPVKTHEDYTHNPVKPEEIVDAQTEYEKLYEVEHEKYVKSHYEDITEASQVGMEEKMQAMYAEHEQKQQELETTVFEFSEVGQQEVDEKLQKLPYAKKPEDYAEYKDIKAVAQEPDEEEIEKLGKIDHSEDPDEIGEVSDELLAQKVKEFEEKYGDKK